MIRIDLKGILKKKGMTMTQLHEKTGISQNALSLLANEKSGGIQFNTLDKILTALQVEIGELIEQVGVLFKLSVNIQENTLETGKPTFEILAIDEENKKYSCFLTFSFKHLTLNNRDVLFITYNFENHTAFPHTLLNEHFFERQEEPSLKVLSYLIATKLIISLDSIQLPENSLVLFSWHGFRVASKGELLFTVPLTSIDKDADNMKLKAIPHLELLQESNIIENVLIEQNEYMVTIYIQ